MDMFGDSGSPPPLDFAKSTLADATSVSSKNPAVKDALGIKGAFFLEDGVIKLELEITNKSSSPLSGFDIMFNKNPFALFMSEATNKIALPAPGQTASGILPVKIDTKNLDAKNPPKSPFLVQIAMKTSLDVFYFTIPCKLNCLVHQQQKITKEDFQKFWQKIAKTNEVEFSLYSSDLYAGFSQRSEDLSQALQDGFKANGFDMLVQTTNQSKARNMMYFGAKSINNLPLLVELGVAQDGSDVNVVFRVPVTPLKGLFEESLRYILTRTD
jgi:hypothetical protein